MNALERFLAAGPDRRAALENALEFYIPPELRAWLGLANELNPVTSMERAGEGAVRIADPNVQGWDKVRAVGDTASNMAGVLAPVVAGSRGAVPAVNAMEEAVMGWSQAAGVPEFVADEFGGVGFGDEVASRGAQIMDMLRAGRGADVTDEMLDMGDPTLNARLNEWLFNNYDLPMDAASRAKRARGLGMKDQTLHGTDADLMAFDDGRGAYTSKDPDIADAYARRNTDAGLDGNPNYIPLAQDMKAANRFGPGYIVTNDPTSLRSRFARFDPRLAHLRNLSAGIGGTVLMSDMFQQDEEEPKNALSNFLAERGL